MNRRDFLAGILPLFAMFQLNWKFLMPKTLSTPTNLRMVECTSTSVTVAFD